MSDVCEQPRDVASLKAEILSLYTELTELARKSVLKVIKIGTLLQQIQDNMGMQPFIVWSEANLPFCRKTAYNYMRCARFSSKPGNMEIIAGMSPTEVYLFLSRTSEVTGRKKGNILARLMSESENYDILYHALGEKLRNEPVDFYIQFVAPKSGKLKTMMAELGFAELTPAQEANAMDSLSSPEEPEEPTV